MFYFIPSWYDEHTLFKKYARRWSRGFDTISFDDTVNQVKMFHSSGESTCLMLLGYQPQLRYFLHKESLSDMSYWSFFDDIQNITLTEVRPLHFKDFNWPEGVRFVYTPFIVVVYLKEERLAEIEFAEDGNLLLIHWFEETVLARTYYFDDRGFISSILYYQSGQERHQDYLNRNGVWQVREYFNRSDVQLEINREADTAFKKSFYANWIDLMRERLELFQVLKVTHEDTFIISSHLSHNDLLASVFPQTEKAYSFFDNRFDLKDEDAIQRLMTHSRFLIVDNTDSEKVLTQTLHQLGNDKAIVHRLTPFDTRLRLGSSQTMKNLIIYCLIDGMADLERQKLLMILLEYMMSNPLVKLRIISYKSRDVLKELEQMIKEHVLSTNHIQRFMAKQNRHSENMLDEDEELELEAITFDYLNTENQIINLLDSSRLVIDLANIPHLYTQIASISAGIPQINRVVTDYVTHQDNGWILDNIDDLPRVLEFYLNTLANWNKSLVHAIEKMEKYTSGEITRQWKEILFGGDEL